MIVQIFSVLQLQTQSTQFVVAKSSPLVTTRCMAKALKILNYVP